MTVSRRRLQATFEYLPNGIPHSVSKLSHRGAHPKQSRVQTSKPREKKKENQYSHHPTGGPSILPSASHPLPYMPGVPYTYLIFANFRLCSTSLACFSTASSNFLPRLHPTYLYTPRVMIARRSMSKGRRMERREGREMEEEEEEAVEDVAGSRGKREGRMGGWGIVD